MQVPSFPRSWSRAFACALCFIALYVLSSVLSARVISVDDACSLNDAILSANQDIASGGCPAGEPGHDEIRLERDVLLTEPYDAEKQHGTPPIFTEITIDGQGHSIERDPDADAFVILSIGKREDPGQLILRNARISFGSGGITQVSGNLTVIDSEISENKRCWGGGMSLWYGKAQIIRSKIINNGSESCNPPIPIAPGRTGRNLGTPAAVGGGIYVSGLIEDFLLVNSTVSGNVLSSDYYDGAYGAGLYFDSYQGFDDDYYSRRIVGSLISENRVDHEPFCDACFSTAGGILSYARRLTIVNSTISNNVAATGSGIVSSAVSFENTTLVNNEFDALSGFEVRAKGTIFSSCDFPDGGILDLGGNFHSGDPSCFLSEEITGLDLELADNGGLTLTHALLPGSNAIGANTNCDLHSDQRGFTRGADCDSGAVEFEAAEPDLRLELSGLCPGTVTATAMGAEPRSAVWFYFSPESVPQVLYREDCPATVFENSGRGVRLRATSDENGRAVVSNDLDPIECGGAVQAFDTTTCAMSPALFVP